MVSNFSKNDEVALLNSMGVKDVINSLTIDDVAQFLESLGVQVIKSESYLICPTICHNPLEEAETMKLYWYQNYKVFHCYTECNESMSIFELYMKYMSINYHDITEEEAVDYIKRFCKRLSLAERHHKSNILTDMEKYQYEETLIELPEYSSSVLDCFSNFHHPIWLREGISEEAMEKFGIKFQIRENRIVIPHYDINGRLVGIRQRSLEEKDIEGGKYRPLSVGGEVYNHELHYNLYGIHEHKEAIQKFGRAILVEGEKSVLLDETYFGKNSVAVAVCGSQINKYQINLLTKELGVNEIILALDKEYINLKDPKAKTYRKKLIEIGQKYKNNASFSYIFDEKDLLDLKDSPYDKGKETFEKLYKLRIKVR